MVRTPPTATSPLHVLTKIVSAEPTSCAVFTPSYAYAAYPSPANSSAPDLSARLPVLCTNSAPLTRSNLTADTSRQIELATPGAGMPDERLDPMATMYNFDRPSQRSLNDDQDYSRKILRVANPSDE